jgi:MFS family permease
LTASLVDTRNLKFSTMGRNSGDHDIEQAPAIALVQLHPAGGKSNVDLLDPTVPSLSRADYTFPEGGTVAWLVVFGASSVIGGTYGLLSSVGLFLAYWKENQLSQYSAGSIGWISAVNIFFTFILGVQVGPLFDRYGPRYLILGGSIAYVLSLVVLGQCKAYWEFVLCYGVVCGISNAFLTTTALAVVAHWFEAKRGIASGITLVGSSVGGVAFPLVLKKILQEMSWAWSMRLVALIVGVLMLIGNIFIKGRLPPQNTGGSIDLRCFKDPRFSLATAGIACGFLFSTRKVYPLRMHNRLRVRSLWSTWNSTNLRAGTRI